MEQSKTNAMEDYVHEHYSGLAKQLAETTNSVSCCDDIQTEDSCCSTSPDHIPSFGSDKHLLLRASINPGEVVVDLGSGPGHDLVAVAKKVGPSGRAIGIDFSQDMINLALENSKREGLGNVELVQSHLTQVALPDNLADLVISNCVFNLVEDKFAAFKEAYRILRPGGRFIISDQITHLDDDQELDTISKCGCIGGARSIEEYIKNMEDVGFFNIEHEVEFSSTVDTSGGPVRYSSVLFVGYK